MKKFTTRMAFAYSSKLGRRFNFCESLVDHVRLFEDDDSGLIHISQTNSDVDVSAARSDYQPVPISRPSFCSIHRMNVENQTATFVAPFPHIPVAVTVLLFDPNVQRLLLTRRAAHMRSFPFAWVPPGGHVDAGESLEAACAREVHEETGLDVTHSAASELRLLCAWESTYPTHSGVGQPSRHHLVLYFTLLWPGVVAAIHNGKLPLEADNHEVDAYAWFTLPQLQAIVDGLDDAQLKEHKLTHFEAWVAEPGGSQFELRKQPLNNLSAVDWTELAAGKLVERISIGTRYAVEQFLAQTQKPKM